MNTRKAWLNGVKWKTILYHRCRYGDFKADRITLVQKVPRYDFEKSLHSDLPEQDLKRMVYFMPSQMC